MIQYNARATHPHQPRTLLNLTLNLTLAPTRITNIKTTTPTHLLPTINPLNKIIKIPIKRKFRSQRHSAGHILKIMNKEKSVTTHRTAIKDRNTLLSRNTLHHIIEKHSRTKHTIDRHPHSPLIIMLNHKNDRTNKIRIMEKRRSHKNTPLVRTQVV